MSSRRPVISDRTPAVNHTINPYNSYDWKTEYHIILRSSLYSSTDKVLAIYLNIDQALGLANAPHSTQRINRYVIRTSNYGNGGAVMALGNKQIKWIGTPLLSHYTHNGRLYPIASLGTAPIRLYAVYEKVSKQSRQYNNLNNKTQTQYDPLTYAPLSGHSIYIANTF